MKTTGIVRRMDELGRIVIPKEIRRTYRIKEGDPIEIFINDKGELTVKKHSPIKDITDIASAYVEAISATAKCGVLVSDNDIVIAAAGVSKKEYLGKPISAELYQGFLGKKPLVLDKTKEALLPVKKDGEEKSHSQIIVPILAGGDIFGAVILLATEKEGKLGQEQLLLANTAAVFLAGQLS